MDYFGCKNSSFFDFEKVEKISGYFWETLGNFLEKLAEHKTPISKIFEYLLIKMQ